MGAVGADAASGLAAEAIPLLLFAREITGVGLLAPLAAIA
jgi:hypothetical protein